MSVRTSSLYGLTGLVTIITMALIMLHIAQAGENADLRILWTNDTHGYLSPLFHREEGDDRFVERAKQQGRVGGFAHIATLVKQQRRQLPGKTLLVDSGDTFHGTVVPVRMGGTPVVEIMNAVGYDAMVPGNVDFFYSHDTIEKLFSAAKFPILIANIYDSQWGERVKLPNTRPYIIKNVSGLKVGIIGMTYHWMSKVADQPQWSFGLRMEEVQQDINRMRATESVDLVIMLSHMGWKADDRYAQLVSGIDVIVGAHTHDTLYRPTLVHNAHAQRDVIIVQAGSHGKMLGQLDLTVKNKRVVAFEQTLFPVRAEQITPDPEIARMIKKFRAPYKKELERVIGETETVLYRQGTWQSPADNMVADALRERTQQDIAVTLPGRFGATILPGKITVEDIYNLVPTESPIYQMKFTGDDIRKLLEGAVDNVVAGDAFERIGANMWRYSGLELVIDTGQAYPNRIKAIRTGGKPIKNDQLYTLAEFNMFLRTSPNAQEIKKTDKIGPHEIIAWVEKKKIINHGLDHRITNTQGQIMSDHAHVHDSWEESGRNHVDLLNAKTYQYRGVINKNRRLVFVD